MAGGIIIFMSTSRALHGVIGAGGFAHGPIWTLPIAGGASAEHPSPRLDTAQADALAALAQARAQLEALAAGRRGAGDELAAEIFASQALMAADPTLIAAVQGAAEAGRTAVEALYFAGEEQAAIFAAIPDEYLAARAADVRDVAGRAVRIITGATTPLPTAPSILVADDLPPSIGAEIPRELLLGIALRGGSRTAHAVILARAAGIPCIVATAGLAIDGSLDGTPAALDGASGTLHLSPNATTIERLRAEAGEAQASATRRAGLRGAPCVLKSGERVHLLANIGSADDAVRAVAVGAEGVGLLRTEFLLLERSTPPSEAEQVTAFRAIFAALGAERPLTLRLADIGGDKEVPYLRIPHEANPFLGVRGYRLAMLSGRADLRALFASQISAGLLAAAAAKARLRVMAPMVAVRAEVDDLLALVATVRADLAQRGAAGDVAAAAAATYALHLGVMIEVPAAALTVATLARGLDFVSIGTNDLTQYVMAADRVNPALAPLQDATAPGVVALLKAIVAGAAEAGVEVGVCGELAGSAVGAKLLTDLGIRELSMDPAVIDEVREALIGA